jgi:hypothetical protein
MEFPIMTKKSTAAQEHSRTRQVVDAAKGRPMFSLPSRFTASPDPDRELVHVVDTQSGLDVKVAASSYGEVRRLLGAFFGGDVEGTDTFVPQEKTALAAPMPQVAARRTSSPARATASPSSRAEKKTSAAKAPLTRNKGADARKASLPMKASEVAQGWEGSIEGGGYRLDYEPDARSGEPGYSVSASGGHKVATVRQDPRGKFVLRWESAAVEPTPHTNLLGVRSRIEVVLDVA